jgi:hypothetical protein
MISFECSDLRGELSCADQLKPVIGVESVKESMNKFRFHCSRLAFAPCRHVVSRKNYSFHKVKRMEEIILEKAGREDKRPGMGCVGK